MNSKDVHEGFWIGVDVAKASFEAAAAAVNVSVKDWAKLPIAKFKMDADGLERFGQWVDTLRARGVCLGVCIESTGCYSHRFVQFIACLELPVVSMVNPYHPLSFRRSLGLRDKSDRVDAALLALYGVVHEPKPTKPWPPEYAHLRELWRSHERYKAEVTRWKNRLEACLDEEVKADIQETLAFLTHKATQSWKKIEQWVREHDSLQQDCQLMCTIPGVAKKTAIMVMAELGDLRTWDRKKIVSYAGLHPVVYESGTSVAHRPRMAKGGGRRIRKHIFYPACAAVRFNPEIRQWREELLARGKAKMCVIGAVMRKLLTLMRGVLVSGVAYDPNRNLRNAA